MKNYSIKLWENFKKNLEHNIKKKHYAKLCNEHYSLSEGLLSEDDGSGEGIVQKLNSGQ